MTGDNDLERTFLAQGDTGRVYTVVQTRAADAGDRESLSFALRDGTEVTRTDEGLFRIEATGELLTRK